MVRLFARFKFPEIDKSYLPIMALLAKWSLSSRCIPIRPGSNEGEFNLIQNLRQKIIYYLSFSAIIFYILTFNIWFYKNFFGKSHPVWENLVIICFFTSINIVGARNYVNLPMLICINTSKFSIPGAILFLFASGVFVPCAPPSVGSVLFHSCPNGWMDQSWPWPGRLINGFILAHAFYLLVSLLVMVIPVAMVYPSLVMELWINKMGR
ncbi:hypothetical protein Fcan01_20893 [Folsomia candida]|uniref:Uncharacterized protein n=1 Tax=Folsomia candida TaxID=158441 RepID=A0A226DI06_FOLCA|nr:hypothetical protein Fcan01_20893 [Folsomia candida]